MDRRIDLDRARRDAKALLRAARAGDPGALARLRPDREPCLADAQHAAARALAQPSWPALVSTVEAQDAAGVAELLELALGGRHEAALAMARARPRTAARLRRTSSSALVDAAREGRADAVYALLELGVDPNVRDPQSGGTALHVAAAGGRVDVVDALVGWVPFDLHARDAAGSTALDACVDGSAAARAGGSTGDAGLVIAKILVSVGLRPDAAMSERASGELGAWLAERLADPRPPRRLGAHLGEAAWSTEAALMEHVSGSPLAEVREVGDGFAFVTGLFDNTRNGVVCSRLASEAADSEIAAVLAWVHERGVPGQWMVAAATEPGDLRERLERAGCRPERAGVFMAAELEGRDLADPRPPAGVDVVAIGSAEQLAEAFAGAGAFDGDPERRAGELALLASLGLDAARPLRHHAARLGGRTIGVASAFATGSTLLLVSLEVAAAQRRRGIGRTLALHALRAGRTAGCSLAVLAPTPATIPFYEGLGFALGGMLPERTFSTPLRESPGGGAGGRRRP